MSESYSGSLRPCRSGVPARDAPRPAVPDTVPRHTSSRPTKSRTTVLDDSDTIPDVTPTLNSAATDDDHPKIIPRAVPSSPPISSTVPSDVTPYRHGLAAAAP